MKRLITIIVILIFSISVSATMKSTDGSFEKETEGKTHEELDDFTYDWSLRTGNADSKGIIKKENDNNFMQINGFFDFLSYDAVSVPYIFSLDARLEAQTDIKMIGIFVRTSTMFSLYEWDFYVEKGGTEGESSIGATGIVITPIQTGIRVSVKSQCDGPWGISTKFNDFTIDNFDMTVFNNIKITDDGSKVSIFVNDNLIATVEMSNKGEYSDDEKTDIYDYLNNTYFKTVVLRDAQDNEIFKLDNARVIAEDCYVGTGVRNSKIDIDNVTLSYEVTETPSPDPTNTPTATEKVTTSPDKTVDKTNKVINKDFNITYIIIPVIVVLILSIIIVVFVKRKNESRKG